MYECPINIIMNDIVTQFEQRMLKAVQRCGIYVDKDELIKALDYDRKQYEKGYADAKSEQHWIPVSEHLPKGQTEVIVSCTDDSGDAKYRYTSSGWITTDGKYWIVDNEINRFVVAWMPLPDPYRLEGDDKHER